MLTLVAQLAMATVFLYSAADKLRHWNESIAEVAGLGIPAPALFAAMTIAAQLIGGLAVATGILAAPGALLLAAFTVAATVLGHRFWLLHGQVARHEFTTALEHLAIVGGLLLVAQIHGLRF
jgi:putative oxidoreductase